MKHKILLSLLSLGMLCAQAALREVSYICPRPTSKPPVIDGQLDDFCWQQTPRYNATYEYFKPVPGPGKLKNSIQLAYDRQGLYLAIVNYDKNTKNLRQNIISRDASDLWTDDCAEIFIGNQPNGPGYRKFTVNSKGIVADIQQVDGNVTLEQWNGMGWIAKNRIYSDRWTIEAFFPWYDLGKTPQPGDVWRFCHTRFAWSSGNFVGTSSSPGGNYKAIDNFGYLYFLQGQEEPDLNTLGNMLNRNVAPPWAIPIGNTLIFNQGNGVQFAELSKMVTSERARVTGMLQKLASPPPAFKKAYDQLCQDLKAINKTSVPPTFLQFRQYSQLAPNIEDLSWKLKIAQEFN